MASDSKSRLRAILNVKKKTVNQPKGAFVVRVVTVYPVILFRFFLRNVYEERKLNIYFT